MSIISETKNELTDEQKNDTTKKCPRCGKLLYYSNKYDCKKSMKKNSPCRGCVADEYRISGRYSGENNPFYGKHHSLDTIRKMEAVDRSWMTGSLNPMKDEEMRKYFSVLYTGHAPMSGKHHTDETKKKLSIALQGNIPWNVGKIEERTKCSYCNKEYAIKYKKKHKCFQS